MGSWRGRALLSQMDAEIKKLGVAAIYIERAKQATFPESARIKECIP